MHEFESVDDNPICDWCRADRPAILETKTPLERMMIMKTVKNENGTVLRVKDTEAEKMVNGIGKYNIKYKGKFEYCPKSEWKKSH